MSAQGRVTDFLLGDAVGGEGGQSVLRGPSLHYVPGLFGFTSHSLFYPDKVSPLVWKVMDSMCGV